MSAELEDIHEECGIFGVWGHPDAARLTYFGLHALQHRGQEGAGIVSNDNGYGIYFRKEDTLYFVEMMATGDRAAEI